MLQAIARSRGGRHQQMEINSRERGDDSTYDEKFGEIWKPLGMNGTSKHEGETWRAASHHLTGLVCLRIKPDPTAAILERRMPDAQDESAELIGIGIGAIIALGEAVEPDGQSGGRIGLMDHAELQSLDRAQEQPAFQGAG